MTTDDQELQKIFQTVYTRNLPHYRRELAGRALTGILANNTLYEAIVLLAKEKGIDQDCAHAIMAKNYADALLDELSKPTTTGAGD